MLLCRLHPLFTMATSMQIVANHRPVAPVAKPAASVLSAKQGAFFSGPRLVPRVSSTGAVVRSRSSLSVEARGAKSATGQKIAVSGCAGGATTADWTVSAWHPSA